MFPREPVAKKANRLIRPLPDRARDDCPARGVKARRALRWRTMVAYHEEVGLFPKIAGENLFRNKIPEALEADRHCKG
jgi:hypothetical protein